MTKTLRRNTHFQDTLRTAYIPNWKTWNNFGMDSLRDRLCKSG